MSKPSFTIKALQLEDVPEVAQLSADAFETDRQTDMKALGQKPFSMKEYALQSLPGFMKHPRCVVLKAVDEETGEIAGFCNWGFRGFSPDEMPVLEGRKQPPEISPPPPKKPAETDTPAAENHTPLPSETEKDPIKRLVALTDADLTKWQEEVMPEGTRCLFVVGLSVSPKFQGRGVGSALLRWATKFCDEKEVFAWVHSSEPAWKMYEKCGFQVIRSLDVDLDDYAPCPPPNEGPDAKWGHYVFRYMKYFGSKPE
ncbi:hypothetical protein PT974_04148 [Cladobotryum mycophilum]|uniref:N-acetyltransferase domain-containing protein n=1 Tax=Cladobotryum mycophilum TaxID=491253 RepID=A0ABR0SVD7_9HYPO